jgi:exocyst complex component 2
MAMDVINLYISQISEIFQLSDVPNMMSAGGSLRQPPHFPENSHSICSAYYLQKIMNDIQDAVNELVVLDIAQDTGLKGFLESVRWRFVDFLITAWLRGWFILLFPAA